MKKRDCKKTLLFLIIICFYGNVLSNDQYKDKIKNMQTIQFQPKEFNEIKLGYYENEMSVCTPDYPNTWGKINTLFINTPHAIICKGNNFIPIIPICIRSGVSRRRYYKYHELSAKMIYVKKGDQELVYCGEIVEPNKIGASEYYPQGLEAVIRQEKNNITEAQQYNDEELNTGQYSDEYWNLNLLDYVDIPFLPGKYEIWVAFSGLESNHMFVEIMME